MNKNITKILSSKFPIDVAKITNKRNFYCLSILLQPTLNRNKNKDLVLTGNQYVVIANALGGAYGYVETFAKVRPYRSKYFHETGINKKVFTGKNMEDVANQLIK